MRRARSRRSRKASWAVFDPWGGEGAGPEEEDREAAGEEVTGTAPTPSTPPPTRRVLARPAAPPLLAGHSAEGVGSEPDATDATGAIEAAGGDGPGRDEHLELDAPLDPSDGSPPPIPWDPSERSPEPSARDRRDPGAEAVEERGPPPDPAAEPGAWVRWAGVPVLEHVVHRLGLSGHDAAIQDLLDSPGRPALRLLVWPRPDRLQEDPARRRATLEAGVEGGREPSVRVRYWRGPENADPVYLAELSAGLLTEAWLRDRLLNGLGEILREA